MYTAFGLAVASDVPCPGLPAGGGEPDIRFREGSVAVELEDCVDRGACFQTAPGRALVRVRGVGRFLIRDGREIVVDRDSGAGDDSLRLFLLGTCLGVLLHQRGGLVLHATTVARGGRAVALVGPSGVGKSTLAAALLERGYALVADEATLVSLPGDGAPLAIPGAPDLLLWRAALDRLGSWSDSLRPARPGLAKYVLPARERFARKPHVLTDVFQLGWWNRNEVVGEPLTGFARFQALLDNTFREPYLFGLGLARQRHALCGALVSRVSVSKLSWPHRWTDLDEAADLIDRVASPSLDRGAASEFEPHSGVDHVG